MSLTSARRLLTKADTVSLNNKEQNLCTAYEGKRREKIFTVEMTSSHCSSARDVNMKRRGLHLILS